MAGLIDLNGLGHFKAKENAMVADTYSASKTYAVGDYVYYNGTLYRCTTAISTTEAWTAGHWTAVKLADDCSSLKTALGANKIEWTSSSYIGTNGAIGSVVNLTPASNASYRCAVVDCTEGDIFYLYNVKGGSTPRLYAFIDTDNKILSQAASSFGTTEIYILTAPENAAKVVFNDNRPSFPGYIYKGLPGYYVPDMFTDMIGNIVYSGTITATKSLTTALQLEKGNYFFHTDKMVSDDTDSNKSLIAFTVASGNVYKYFERNKPINLFFDLTEDSTQLAIYASTSANLSTGDDFTLHGFYIAKLNALGEKIESAEKYTDMPFHKLESNPYQCPFDYFEEAISTTHAHCLDDTQIVNLANNYDHVAISNYHPSVPWYPLENFFGNPLLYQEYKDTLSGTKMEQVTQALPAGDYVITVGEIVSSDTDTTTSCIAFIYGDSTPALKLQLNRGENITQDFTLTSDATSFYVYASDGAPNSNNDTYTWSNLTIFRKISNALDNFLASPNAEQAGFPSADVSVHINGVGSFLSKETENNGKRLIETCSDIINSLQFAQMGGITINHPTYNSLSGDDICRMLDEIQGIFGMEIYNSTCEASYNNGYSLTQWDYVLAKGKQIYGLAVPDHEVQYHPTEGRVGFGYCHVMVRAKTEQQILNAYSCGRFYTSIYNDSLKFTNLYYKESTGFTVETSTSATIKFITANGTVSTTTGTSATYVPTYNDVYVRVEATDGTNTLYSNAVIV